MRVFNEIVHLARSLSLVVRLIIIFYIRKRETRQYEKKILRSRSTRCFFHLIVLLHSVRRHSIDNGVAARIHISDGDCKKMFNLVYFHIYIFIDHSVM